MKSVNYGSDATEVFCEAVDADTAAPALPHGWPRATLEKAALEAPAGSLGLSDAKCTFHSVSLGPLRKRTYNEPKVSDNQLEAVLAL
jgi:hypothetical protein